MSLLSKWLDKAGIKKVEDLSPDEKAVYDRYNAVLRGENLTIETIKTFCETQIKVIEAKCDGVTPLTTLQQACLHVYFQILKAIEAPEAERVAVEQHLIQLIGAPDA